MIDLTSSAFAEHCTWIALCGSMSDPKHLSVFIAQTVTCWQGEQLSVTRHSRDRKIRSYTTILGSFAVVVRFQASTLLVSSHVNVNLLLCLNRIIPRLRFSIINSLQKNIFERPTSEDIYDTA